MQTMCWPCNQRKGNEDVKIIIDDGATFEGDAQMFQDVFFSFSPGFTDEQKISQVTEWARKNGMKLEVQQPRRGK
jgi:hypothetical protein